MAVAVAMVAAVMASGATSNTTVTMTVPSAIAVTNNCSSTAATAFGVVQPGSGATTSTGAGICNVAWSSTNDSSMLRIAQRDGAGTAMTRASTLATITGWTFYGTIDTIDGTTAIAGGSGGAFGRTTNSGLTWSNTGNLGGIGGEITDVEHEPGDATVAWVVGYGGRVQRVTNLNGAKVVTDKIGDLMSTGWPVTGDVHSVAVVDSNTVFIGGPSGWFAKTVNGGTNWTAFQKPGTNSIASLEISPTGHVWAVSAGNATGNIWRALVTAGDTSASWTQFANAANTTMNDIVVPDATHGYAVGNSGGIYFWNGATWSWKATAMEPNNLFTVTSPPGQPATAVIAGKDGAMIRTTDSATSFTRIDPKISDDIYAIEAGTGGIVGTGISRAGYSSSDGGITWTWQSDSGDANRNRIATAAQPVDGKVLISVGSRGSTWRSTDTGASWTYIPSGTTESFYDVAWETSSIVWAVGTNGTIMRSADAGLTWSPRTSGTNVRLRAVSSGDAGQIIAIGDNGAVVRSNNGGTSFVVTTPSAAYLDDVSMASSTLGMIVGDTVILRTTDGGATWAAPPTTPAPDTLLSVAMTTTNVGYVGTDSLKVWRTADGGLTWTSVNVASGSINGVDGIGPNDAYAIANNVIYQSADGGLTWTNQFTATTKQQSIVALDANAVVTTGMYGSIARRVGSITAADQIPDYGAAPNSWAPSAQGMFGVCLQNLGGSAVPVAPFTDDANTCTGVDTDVWQPVTIAPVKVASAPSSSGSVDLVFGVRFPSNQAPGSYSAGVVFEALAPFA